MTSRDDLLAVIAENPDDHAGWMLYADWLQQRGEPRGELIALDVALETASDEQKQQLEAARGELIKTYATALLGETFSRFVASGYGKVVWRRGFITTFGYSGSGRSAHKRQVGWLVKLMADNPEPFTFLKVLMFAHTDVADLKPFVPFKHMTDLDLRDTNVRDISPLLFMTRLSRVTLVDCEVDEKAIEDVQRQRPELRIIA